MVRKEIVKTWWTSNPFFISF